MPTNEPLRFRVSLRPSLYREIEIPGGASLYELADVAVRSFGFDFDHAFGFYSRLTGNYHSSPERYELFEDTGDGDGSAKGVERTPAVAAFRRVGRKMRMLFDYGDGWEFVVERLEAAPAPAGAPPPSVIKSVGKAPRQYPALED